MADLKRFTLATEISVYFCDPHSPWQRGTNENTTGVLRQYLLKGTDLSQLIQEDLDAIALQMNNRPRKVLGFRSLLEVYAEIMHKLELAKSATLH